MPINIRNREVEQLVDELRHETGRGITEIVLDLLRREVARTRRLRALHERRRRIESLVARYRARLPAQTETPETIIGYDEHGLPLRSSIPPP